MKVVIAIDSFKDSMSSLEAGNAARAGVLRACPEAEVAVIPVADGGEGTVQALCHTGTTDCECRCIKVTGAPGEKIEAAYSIITKTSSEEIHRTAVIEMASAAGLMLVPKEKRNPLYTTTYGVGEMIRDAIACGCRNFIIGIGGSATNDGGIGMLQALGYSFMDERGEAVPFGARGLIRLSDIGFENVMPELSECSFRIACDVKNPLVGEMGASRVFAPQKGADEKLVRDMEIAMNRYANLAEHIAECDSGAIHQNWLKKSEKAKNNANIDRHYPGAGAAGGVGFAFLMFLNATLEPGVDIILDEVRLTDYIKDADYVITGEGRLDSQTIMGKTPAGVGRLAKRFGKKVIAFAGSVDEGIKSCMDEGIFDSCFSIIQGITTMEEALKKENAVNNLATTVEQVFRLLI